MSSSYRTVTIRLYIPAESLSLFVVFKSHNFRTNDRVELILVPNNVIFLPGFKNAPIYIYIYMGYVGLAINRAVVFVSKGRLYGHPLLVLIVGIHS